MDLIIATLGELFTIKMLLLSCGSVALGILFGALPGLGPASGMSLLLPITYFLQPQEGQVVLLGLYTGAIYGGSWAAILVNIPGCPASLMTTLDGYPMAQKGEAGRALGLSVVCSFIGGLFGILALICISPVLAGFALSFAAPEYAALALLGLSSIVIVSAKDYLKGFIAVTLGLIIALVGTDPIVNIQRFTFGIIEFQDGINYIVIIIGVFGIGEVFAQLLSPPKTGTVLSTSSGRVLPSREDWKRIARHSATPCALGTFIGALPGAGASIAAMLSYNRAVQASPTPERFGTGIPEGIIASETANNASIGGAIVPLLTLGIPGSTATAVLLGGLMIHNIVPGPVLFTEHANLVYVIFGALILADIFMLLIGLGSARYVSHILRVPMPLLFTVIVVVSILGTYCLHDSLLDVTVLMVSGLVGYLLRVLEIPLGAFILGLVLGPIVESNLRSALEMSFTGPLIFVTRPVSGFILAITALIVLQPLLKQWRQRRKKSNTI